MVVLNFPDPAGQTPANTFSPTSTPSASTNGITYVWDGEKWVAQAGSDDGGTGSGAVVHYEGPTPPSTVTSNVTDQWYNTNDGRLYTLTENENGDKVWIDASPPGSGGGDGDGGGIPEAPTDGQQYARQNSSWSVVQAGDNNTTINYQGAAAWGVFDQFGNMSGSLNSAVARTGAGVYQVTFNTPMPTADYAINCTAPAGIAAWSNKSANGFVINTVALGTGVATDYLGASFAVHALNALPPQGGTGTDAWGTIASRGVDDVAGVLAGFNIASARRTALGVYEVTFTNPMPNADYSAVATGEANVNVAVVNKTTTTCTFSQIDADGQAANVNFSFAVNATNATLPETITEDQIAALIQNPVLSAWGDVAGDGTFNNGFNIASVTRTATGRYDVVFTNAMPNADYSLVGSTDEGVGDSSSIRLVIFDNKATTGFSVITKNSGSFQDYPFDFQVAGTARNGTLGGGADAWCLTSQTSGTIETAFNIADVQNIGTGTWRATFANPMPSGSYSVVGNCLSPFTSCIFSTQNRTANSFEIRTVGSTDSVPTDTLFAFSVFATDGNAGGFWVRTGDELAPLSPTADVEIGDGDITLNADGSAEFAGDVQVGGAREVDAVGASLESFGGVRATRPSTQVDPDNATVWEGWLGTDVTSQITADGSATFNGRLVAGTTTSTQFHLLQADGDTTSGALRVDNFNTADARPAALFTVGSSTVGTTNVLIYFALSSGANGAGAIVGNGAGACTFGAFSDRRLKTDITELPSQWDNIKALKPSQFKILSNLESGTQVGFIAQEFQEVYPEAVATSAIPVPVEERSDPDVEETVDRLMLAGWSKTEAYLVKALQECMTRIETLEATNASLEARLNALEGGN